MLNAQKRKERNEIPHKLPLYIETHIFPSDSLFTCLISYKIPFSNILFIKENTQYTSGYTISFELYINENLYKRIYSSSEVSTDNYSETLSENIYSEGFVAFEITEGNFQIRPSIIINNTDIEARIKPIELIVDSTQIYKPFFVNRTKLICDSINYQLVNFQNSIPFSEGGCDMLIPSFSEFQKSINLEILQNDKSIMNSKIYDTIFLNETVSSCNNQIVFTSDSTLPLIKFFKVNNVNQKLAEGEFEVSLELGKENINYKLPVLWFNKPNSLNNIEEAIDYLTIIGLSKSADSLSNFSEDAEYKALFNFWRRYDDDTSTVFNSVFAEYYSRIDYVKEEFNSVGKNDALETDRGRTYINLGRPDNIARKFNDVYDVIEVWEYKSLNEKIYFSDKTGTGKFERIK
ncbi:MAG: GWxTD domain-containing protein [Bacteroidetes bacterium]|nr:GWxTD domain-containing protein [Bacteroidota bacterium]MBU1115642.1 GWxTD domain-containing protein [Bacteroidota bacterium]MBU1800347.1 GWxTD domain-containing protein [Bacteroidota bacterium]